ncbi:hypothetical protein [Amycolatopsis sp. 195334CR]|uniref:hypothetical protein n=1 Tax=Amycolatopsis sp. 195334CR TaxID=2814588 RepID=UPI001A8D72BC|nr:hypothetical protein [Amycolatopsis sp. 195334CR]MBN6037661.1 hypothetical protein [Amycolatopsis sp. 195334CR]
MQPGYPPPQGYQGHPQGYPGYPGYPPPKKSNTGLIVTLCLVGVLLLGGLGVGAYFLIDSNSSSSRSAPISAPSSAAGPPDRFTKVPGCTDVESRVSGLPEKMSDETKDLGTSDPDVTMNGHSCLWDSGESPIRVELSIHLSTSLPGKSGAGAAAASRYYDTMAGQGTPGGSADVPGADKATRTSFNTDECSVHVLIGNAYIGATYYADADASISTSTCESDVLKVATAAAESL